MANLKELLAKQRGQNAESTSGAGGTAVESNEVPRTQESGAPTAQRPKNPFSKGPSHGSAGNGGSTGNGPQADSGNDSGGEQPRPKLASLGVSTESQRQRDDASEMAPLAIDSLDDLDASTAPGIEPDRGSLSHFSDETPATAPTRELPEGLTKEQLGFVDLIDGVYNIVHEPDLMGQAIRTIMIELKSNPEYTKLICDEDVRTWVRGMRDSMGLAKIKKTEAKAKKAGGTGRKSKLVEEDALKDLDDLLSGKALS